MSQTYYSPQYSNNNQEYIQSLVNKEVKKYQEQGKVQNAMFNPKTEKIHVTVENPTEVDNSMWSKWPAVLNYGEYRRLKANNASGQRHANDDQAQYNFFTSEFQDQALRFYDEYKAKGAAVITSTEFPQITVTTVSQALLNRQQLVTQKYNLLGIPEKMTVSDTINIIFPEYNNTNPSTVRVGYKENEPIDTSGYGAFTQTNVSLKKAGAGLAFTEEYYMRQFTMDIQSLLLEKIAIDFTAARYSRILAKIVALTGFAAVGGGDWFALAASNLVSQARPQLDLNAAKLAIQSDKLAVVDTIVTNEKQWMDFYANTWIKGTFSGSPDAAATTNINQIVTNPAQIPWAKQWIINEDIANDVAFVFDHRMLVDIEGPRKTQQINTYNPDQTIFIQKEWFDIVTPSTRSAWGKKITGI